MGEGLGLGNLQNIGTARWGCRLPAELCRLLSRGQRVQLCNGDTVTFGKHEPGSFGRRTDKHAIR